jgi:antitoxin component of RelBE/YafQ-DinJ toxin-antitoxin module
MAQAISVRLDEEALRALGLLEATGMTRSEAIRAALVEAATRLCDKRALAAEVAALEADEEDRTEMLAVADLMESLRAPRRHLRLAATQGRGPRTTGATVRSCRAVRRLPSSLYGPGGAYIEERSIGVVPTRDRDRWQLDTGTGGTRRRHRPEPIGRFRRPPDTGRTMGC